MAWTIRDSFTLAMSRGSAKAAVLVNARILESIRKSVKNVQIICETPIVFRRPLRQGGFSGIKSFGSGEISVRNTDDRLEVEYRLGIEPYLYLMLFVPGVAFLLYLQTWPSVEIALVVAAMTAYLIARLAYNKHAVGIWFKGLAKAALEEA
jgi:hypothetical protein